MHRLALPLSMVGAAAGLGALLLYAHRIPRRSGVSAPDAAALYDQLALHMWFLEMILVIVGITVAVLGALGYQAVKEVAVRAAEKETRAYLERERAGIEDTGQFRAPAPPGAPRRMGEDES